MTSNAEAVANTSGKALIKSQYLYSAGAKTNLIPKDDAENSEPTAKKSKLEEKKKNRGQNKNRFYLNKNGCSGEPKLCQSVIDVREGADWPVCTFTGCKFLHDVKNYLMKKPADIGSICYSFNQIGYCPRGVTCRFGSEHITADGRNKINDLIYKKKEERTLLTKDLQNKLRKRNYDFSKANDITKNVLKFLQNNKDTKSEEDTSENGIEDEVSSTKNNIDDINLKDTTSMNASQLLGCEIEGDKLNVREKKKIDWSDKLYLSPLTTLGNLPFRRICKEWGADVTCGEMAMAGPILQGVACEWALLRRHSSENLFGVQLCGNNPHLLSRCVQLVEETADVDFIDLNLGCPIELVYKTGAGSGLLRRKNNLESVVRSMSAATNLPITVKTRMGIYDDKPVAHVYMPLFSASGASLITVHGRSREQRYTRQPNWSYVDKCAALASPTPVFGNGDILSYHDYNDARINYPNISGIMIGRGALYKPWIFTEIKEQRDWDISSAERFEILKKFVNYGLEHWGSDTKGVENTRRFLLEWLSFLYRYIPIGLLERPPQKMNERPPRYVGRDDLETLMASPNCTDWIKISEMLCGPVPDGFVFLPKHKANSWASE